MPKKTIKELEADVAREQGRVWKLQDELENVNVRIKQLTAENESLKADKSWLKSMHSNMLQATSEMFRNR